MNTTLGRWLVVTLAVVGLALAVPAVGAHGDDPTPTNETAAAETPTNDTTVWPDWMADHMGSAATEWMESHMGVTGNDSTQGVAGHHWADDDTRDHHWDDDTRNRHWNDDDTRVRGTDGHGHGC
jgi:hypothetical protein